MTVDSPVALVTGAGGILGSRITKALLAQDWTVVLVDRDGERLEEVQRDLSSWATRCVLHVADITDRAAMVELRDRLIADVAPVEALVNNAATKSEHFFEPFETFPVADWDEVMSVNCTAMMLGCQVFGAGMAERGHGSIVNILSIYGIVAPDQRIYEGSLYEGRAINTPAVYSASKAAAWGLTRYLAAYWGHRGVRVNAVTPGGVFSGQNSTFTQRYSARVPMDRMAEPHEIADAVAFLVSERASYVNGHNLVVDGGLSIW